MVTTPNTDVTTTPTSNRKTLIVLGVIVAVSAVVILGQAADRAEEAEAVEAVETTQATVATTVPAKPAGTAVTGVSLGDVSPDEQALAVAIGDAGVQVREVRVLGDGTIDVTFAAGLVWGDSDEVKVGLAEVLTAVAGSGVDTGAGVLVAWETSGTDQYGNEIDDAQVARVFVDGETMGRVNWSADEYALGLDVLPGLWEVRMHGRDLVLDE